MWVATLILGLLSAILCYLGMTSLDIGFMGVSMVLAVVALVTLFFPGEGGKKKWH